MSFFIGFTSDLTKAEVFTSKNDDKTNFRNKKLRFMCRGKGSRIENLFKISALPAICRAFENPFCGKKNNFGSKTEKPVQNT